MAKAGRKRKYCIICHQILSKNQKKVCCKSCRGKYIRSFVKKIWSKGLTKEDPRIAKICFKKGHKVNVGKKRKPFSEKTRKKLSEARKGQHNSIKTEFKKGKNLGEKHPRWKGGVKHSEGYIYIYSPKHPKSIYSGYPYIAEHRLVIEKIIGKYLTVEINVHHVNGIKDDNRPENLIAFKDVWTHKTFEFDENKIKSEDIIFDGRKY